MHARPPPEEPIVKVVQILLPIIDKKCYSPTIKMHLRNSQGLLLFINTKFNRLIFKGGIRVKKISLREAYVNGKCVLPELEIYLKALRNLKS